ncbi:hypothetical protein AC629_18965 [Bradyrhizobium sp. NAS80.1]|nr:hypothetical protein AC629_18965 [Bradyrhizobium sp. NAS80.1]
MQRKAVQLVRLKEMTTALSLFHSGDATFMIIMFNIGTAMMFVGLGGLFGRHMMQWIAPRPSIRD